MVLKHKEHGYAETDRGHADRGGWRANLKQQPGKNITISGSPRLIRSLLRAGLIDELHLILHPVVVGDGKRLFPDGSTGQTLKLLDSKTFSTGVVYLTYQPM